MKSTITRFALMLAAFTLVGCASASTPAPGTVVRPAGDAGNAGSMGSGAAPSPDPRIGLRAGLMNAEEAIWNMRVVSKTQPSAEFIGSTNSDLAFKDNYVIQGNYNGYQVWDISNPAAPVLVKGFVCPASQSDVSVYRNLLFVSGEGASGRLDCGKQGVEEAVSHDRLRGIRIFDITDIRNPKYVGNVQTCRGSHTHTVLEHPGDNQNVYIYVSGSAGIRPAEELAGCSDRPLSEDPNSARFRIEVIQVPLANPAAAKIVSSPRIFQDLVAPPTHGLSHADSLAMEASKADVERRRAAGAWIVTIQGQSVEVPPPFLAPRLDSIMKARGGTGVPSAADTAALRKDIQVMVDRMVAQQMGSQNAEGGPAPGPTQCHDITVYPAIGLAGGACEGYGLLLDISDPINPRRIDAVSDKNFSYWHSATFNNDGTKLLFSDEWGGGGGPKCRVGDPKEWGADAIFTIDSSRKLNFQSYYKLPVVQTSNENCVAHNGSLIPIPGRDVMIQAWYQGGLSLFDFTDPKNPHEIGFFDRGPSDSTRLGPGGSWSVYWYNGNIVSSEIARGLDILELVPSAHISANEIAAAKTVRLDHLNTQGQPKFVWPPSFALARAYVDQLERSGGLAAGRIAEIRSSLATAESASGSARRDALTRLASSIDGNATGSRDAAKVRTLAAAVRDLSTAQ
ncbi:MAG TPA: hypothetical protein VF035_04740 [Longimicrobiales bacterium]